jgi:hypothetical protein
MKFTYFTLLFITYFFGFAQDTLVAKKSNLGLIAATEMNVVYRGVRNPIEIAVPHAKSYTISGLGVKKENGKYYIVPGAGNEMVVTLEIILDDDSKVVEEHVFRILNIGKVQGRINERNCKDCIVIMQISELQNAEISVYFEDFIIEQKMKVSSFSIKFDNTMNLEIAGNKIDEGTFNQLKKLKNNFEFKIHNINYTEGLFGSFQSAGEIHVRISH